MQRLRPQVEQIDLKILKLLQQRTKLSTQIGAAKRRYGAEIYVPERERELLARLKRQSKGKLSGRAVAAIYREIFSSSRAAQGQAPIGLLWQSVPGALLPGRWCFGTCDEFLPKKTWKELASSLVAGELTLALLTGDDLARILKSPATRQDFLSRFTIVGEVPTGQSPMISLAGRIFIVTPRGKGAASESDRILILIECKFTRNAVKSLLRNMPDRTIDAEELPLRARKTPGQSTAGLLRMAWSKRIEGVTLTSQLLSACKLAGLETAILGVYTDSENYGG